MGVGWGGTFLSSTSSPVLVAYMCQLSVKEKGAACYNMPLSLVTEVLGKNVYYLFTVCSKVLGEKVYFFIICICKLLPYCTTCLYTCYHLQ